MVQERGADHAAGPGRSVSAGGNGGVRIQRPVPVPLIGREEGEGAVRASPRARLREVLRIPAMTNPAEKRRVVREVVQRQDQHQRLRPEQPRVRVPKRQLLHLAGVSHAERRGREVEAGPFGGGEFFETEVELGGDRDLPGLHEGIPDDGEVATRRRAFAGRRFPVEETEAVGAGDLPVVETVRRAYFGAGRTDETHSGPEHQRVGRAHEGDDGPERDLAGRADHRQSGRRQERVRGEHPESRGHERAPAQPRARSRVPAGAADPPDADSRSAPVTDASGATRGVFRRRAGARERSRPGSGIRRRRQRRSR